MAFHREGPGGPRLLLVAGLAAGALSCQRSGGPSFQGALELSIADQSGPSPVVGTLTGPCQLQIDFGTVPVGQQAAATIAIDNLGATSVTFSVTSPSLAAGFSVGFANLQQPLPPGSIAKVPVSFAPAARGPAASTISIPTNLPAGACGSSDSSISISLSGNGVGLSLVVTPSSLDFGDTLVSTSAKRTVTLSNPSSVAVTGLTGAVSGASQSFFSLDGVPSWLDAGAAAPLDVTYLPLEVGSRSSATVTFSGADGEMATLSLAGEPVAFALIPSPTTVDFGYVPPATQAVACTTVTNQSNIPVSITGIAGLAGMGAFALSQFDGATPPNPAPVPTAVAPGASAPVCFSFNPPLIEQYSGQVTLQTTDPSGNNPVLQLTGWGGGPQLRCAPTSIGFPPTVDNTTATLSMTCTNSGAALPGGINLTITGLTVSPEVFGVNFDPSVNPYPAGGLAPGESVQIDVFYHPISASNDVGSVTISSNAGQGQPVQIPVTGQGLELAPCQFVISPAALNFGNLPQGGSSVPLSFRVDNIGTDTCLAKDLTLKDLSGSFHLLSQSIAADPQTGWITIPAPGPGVASSLTVTLDFEPTAPGPAVAELDFWISDPGQVDQAIPLSGSSESTCLWVVPTGLSFGTVGEDGAGTLCPGTSRSFTVFNACQTQTSVQSFAIQSGPGDLVPQFSTPMGALPLTLDGGAASPAYTLSFDPTTVGSHSAQLLISDGTVEVLLPLNGEAVDGGTETDSFVVGLPKADVLFVQDVDDDPTVQASIAQAAPGFFQAGAGVDYRVAVTTDDDYAADVDAEFGRLLPCPTCSVQGPAPTIISPSSIPAGETAADPATAFADLLSSVPNDHYPTGTPNDEHLILATYNALRNGPEPGVDFFRPGAFFAALTDNDDNEPDYSALGPGAHDVAWFESFFATYFQDQPFSWSYANGGTAATGTGFTNPTLLAANCEQMVSASGGIAVNTSDPSWQQALNTFWDQVISASSSYRLLGAPSQGSAGILVTRNGTPVPQSTSSGNPNWAYDAAINAITFTAIDTPVNGDRITITYPVGCQ